MSFYLEEECEVSFDFPYEKLAESVVDFCLKEEGFPCGAEVNLTLTDNDGIRKLNRKFRGIDAPTDVLSFPMLCYETPGDFSFLEEEGDDFNPDTGDAVLGDIVISVDKVREQARSYGHSEKREFAFLVVHSMLHLFGYDHMEEDETFVMEEKQRELLAGMEIPRS